MKRKSRVVRTIQSRLSTNMVGRSIIQKLSGLGRINVPWPGRRWIRFRLPKVSFRTGRFVLLVFVIGALFFIMSLLLSINPTRSELDQRRELVSMRGPDINILLVGYDQSSDDFKFIDYLGIVSINQSEGQHRLVMISPEFTTRSLTGNDEKLRNFLNLAEINDADKMQSLMNAVEKMVALRLDRYIAFDIDEMSEFIYELGVQHIADGDVRDVDAGNFRKDEILSDSRLTNYLAAEHPSEKIKQARLGGFTKTQILNWSSWFQLPRLITYKDYLLDLLKTDLSREEIISLVPNLIGVRKLQVISIDPNSSYRIESDGTLKFVPLSDHVDQVVKSFFTRESVRREQVRVEVFNATGVPGLALYYERLFENLGTKVSHKGNFPDRIERTRIYTNGIEGKIETVQMINEVLNERAIILEEVYPYNHTGGLIVVLGEDSVGLFNL